MKINPMSQRDRMPVEAHCELGATSGSHGISDGGHSLCSAGNGI